MVKYDWPGNIRELENSIQYAVIHCTKNIILPEHLPTTITSDSDIERNSSKRHRKRKLGLDQIRQVLYETNGNKVQTARRLGVSRATLYRFFEVSKIRF